MSYNLLKGKRGIITGALDENSIAWKVAEKAHEEGAGCRCRCRVQVQGAGAGCRCRVQEQDAEHWTWKEVRHKESWMEPDIGK